MKRSFCVLFFLVTIPFAAIAQEQTYDSLLDGEKVWTIKSVVSNLERTVSYIEYKLMESVSIDGVSYKQLFTRSKWENEEDWSEWKWLFDKAYIGEDNEGKVYYFVDHGTYITNDVTMDFSLQVGDVFELNEEDYPPFVVTAVSDTKPRRCIHLSMNINGEIIYEDWASDIWIEGIGSVKKGVMGTNASSGSIQQLIKCTQQGNVIYQYDNTTSVQGIKHQPIDKTHTFNLAGQRVNASYKGIVIQNGKKVIVK